MASDDLTAFEAWAGALLARLDPAARRRIARDIGMGLRRRQQQRIRAQRNPDGSPFEARKQRLRGKRGAIRRRAMFQKLATARFLRVRTLADAVAVGFFGRVARIARVHQYGLQDQVAPGGPRVRYPTRRLVGFSPGDSAFVRDALLRHLAGGDA
ncbi:phage tail completion protein [Alcanivorax sp. S71-1-4]|uniref:phage virion morphogenesis protein n=1 Tax=Alcanivorax sp. S71-1-4 TaxID=1177159 RepID=UPI00135CD61B|nr:phage virion morphogenesis protein [Alcanivorax sp. S71-1-4]KAF0810438.1 phage tail completion protein [Alcanivorax sp. S71-1-4]